MRKYPVPKFEQFEHDCASQNHLCGMNKHRCEHGNFNQPAAALDVPQKSREAKRLKC